MTYTPSKFPPAQTPIQSSPYTVDTNLTATGSIARNTFTAFGSSYTPTVSGFYAIYAECDNITANANDSIDTAQLRIKVAGSVVATGPSSHRYQPDTPSKHCVFAAPVNVAAGQAITIEVSHSANGSGTTAAFGNCVLKTRFIPTREAPQ